jgi:hypothetical protein
VRRDHARSVLNARVERERIDHFSDEILAQGLYAARGKRDTTNQSDMLFGSGGASPEQVLFETAQRPDGVLHAWKVLSVHS